MVLLYLIQEPYIIMKKTALVIFSVLLWTFFVLTSMVLLPIACVIWLISRWFDRRLVILHLFSCFWGSLYIWCNPLWRVHIEGRNKLPWKRPAILVSNHQSMVDILVLYRLFAPYKWVSKKENFMIPILGWQMRLNEYLEIDRNSRESLGKLMRKASHFLKLGCPILIFPEGTRHPGGKLGPFKEGAFKMAHENGVDIIPIIIDGTARALPKKGVILTGYSRIRVRVLDPIPYEEFSGRTIRETQVLVRELMSEEHARLQLTNG